MDIWRDVDFGCLFSIIIYKSYFDYLMFYVIDALVCYSPRI